MPDRTADLLSALMAIVVATLNSTGIIGVKSVLAFSETLPNGNLGVAIALAVLLVSRPVIFLVTILVTGSACDGRSGGETDRLAAMAIGPGSNWPRMARTIFASRRFRLTMMKFDTASIRYGAGIVRRLAPAVPARGAVLD